MSKHSYSYRFAIVIFFIATFYSLLVSVMAADPEGPRFAFMDSEANLAGKHTPGASSLMRGTNKWRQIRSPGVENLFISESSADLELVSKAIGLRPDRKSLFVSSGIVISQVYGGGGNSGATYKNDFIELFNRGNAAVNVNGWSVQYTSSAGTSWAVTNLTNVTIQPGQYYLVQEAVGAGGTTNLPTPDATGTIAMSATAGKIALVNTTTALTGSCPTGATIIDLAGYGSGANCFEGTGPTPAPSNTTADLRGANGCTDTDQNATDFTAGAPNPRNTVTTLAPCGGGGGITISINNVTQAETNSGTTLFNFTVSLSASAPAGGVTFDIATADGTTNPANAGSDYVAQSLTGQTITVGNSTYPFAVTVNGDNTPEANETFFVNVTNVVNATPTSVQGLGTISNDDVTATPIHTIQSSGSTSPLVGNPVTTIGIVTGLKSNGFFLQEPDATIDANPNTSEGIFVFTSSAPPAAAAIGNSVQVSGTVQEFIPSQDPTSPPTTELITPTVTLLSTGNPLPVPHTITAAETTAPSGTSNPLDSLEEFEGMRVTVPSLTVSGATQGTITEPSATVSSNGVFIGVVTGVARPFREPGIAISDPVPAPNPVNVPRFDENPQRIRVDSDAQPGTTAIDVAAGTVITNITGPLDYAFRVYTIDPDAATPPVVGIQPGSTAVPVPTANELTVASFNMERFFDTVNDPSTSDPVLTAAAFNRRVVKASLVVRTVQRYPDVIGVQEMENLTTLQAVAAQINSDAVTIDALPNPNYTAYLVEGNDIGGIDVGYLVKQSRVTPTSVTQLEVAGCDHVTPSTCNNYVDPNTGGLDILNDRPPLVLIASIPRPGGGTLGFTVIVNHLRSLNGVDDTTVAGSGTVGARVREKRRKQAEFLANYIQGRQVANATEKIITVGDMNAFRVNDGFVDSIGTILGTPAPADQVVLPSADLVNPNQTDLVDNLTALQQYSYNFDGNAQTLDHIIVNPPSLAILNRFAYARNDSDFAVKNYESTNELRISDHDQPVAYFNLANTVADLSITKTDGVTTAVPGGSVTYTITASNPGAIPATGATVADTFPAILTATWTCTGSGGGTCTASGSGNISDTVNLPAGASVTYTVTAAISASATGTLSNTATVTLAGDPNTSNNSATDTDTLTAPSVFVIDDVAKLEGNAGTTAFVFTVTKTGATGFATAVQYQTIDGTATVANNDYVPTTGTLNFGPAEVTKTITVLVNGDTTIEPNETFFVRLSNNPVNALIGDGEGQGTIQNDDFPATPTPTPTPIPTPTPTPSPNPTPVFGFEGDVNRTALGVPGGGDRDVNVGDQIQYQRFLSGIDCPASGPNEQQRLDAGPRVTFGDGLLGATDGTAIDAYARHDGTTDFDPNTPGWQPTPTAGPATITNLGCTRPAEPEGGAVSTDGVAHEPAAATAERAVRLVSVSGAINTDVFAEVELEAQGNEVGIQYSIHFDPAVLSISNVSGLNTNADVTLGAGAPIGTTLNVNAEDAANGNIGVGQNFNGANTNPGTVIAAGTQRIARLKFHILNTAGVGASPVTFINIPISRGLFDANGFTIPLPPFTDGIVTVAGPPTFPVSGRVTAPSGAGLRSTTVFLTDPNGVRRTATTSSFGFYQFDDVVSGITYTMGVTSRSYRFSNRQVNVTGPMTNIDFVGLE